jgi:hypothetical protein
MAKNVSGMTVPEIPRFVADDVTQEKLASLMAAQGGRIGVLSAEGGIFGIMAGRYSANRSHANISVYLKGHAGDTLRVDRQGRAPEFIDRPALTLGLAVQPDVIHGLGQQPGFRGQGLLARFLYASPKSRVGHRDVDPPPVPDAVRAVYHAKMRSLLELPFGTDAHGTASEHVITLSLGAYEVLMAFSAWLEPQLADFGPLAHMADWAGKLAGGVVRVAGLLHVSDHAGGPAPWSIPIPESTMRRAITIGEYLIPHARAAFAEMGCDPAVADARYVLEWIRRGGVGSFTRRDCFEGTKSRFGVVENLRPALDLLEAHNYLRERLVLARAGRGRPPSPTYDVNPAALAPTGISSPVFAAFSFQAFGDLVADGADVPGAVHDVTPNSATDPAEAAAIDHGSVDVTTSGETASSDSVTVEAGDGCEAIEYEEGVL